MQHDLDEVIKGWPFDPECGEYQAREIRTQDGREALQVRVELGLLQLEVTGRPDGVRPHGFDSYFDYLRHSAARERAAPRGKAPGFLMSKEQCAELDREFIQLCHRRMAWLALGRHDRVIQDAEQTIALMDFVRRHGIDLDYVASHEQFRGIVLLDRALAAAALALKRNRPAAAIDAVRDGIERLTTHQRVWWEEHDTSESPNPAMVERLCEIEQKIREKFLVTRTLREQLAVAVEREDYEQAARLRDQIQAEADGRR
jgi:UvrB/uvrC motif